LVSERQADHGAIEVSVVRLIIDLLGDEFLPNCWWQIAVDRDLVWASLPAGWFDLQVDSLLSIDSTRSDLSILIESRRRNTTPDPIASERKKIIDAPRAEPQTMSVVERVLGIASRSPCVGSHCLGSFVPLYHIARIRKKNNEKFARGLTDLFPFRSVALRAREVCEEKKAKQIAPASPRARPEAAGPKAWAGQSRSGKEKQKFGSDMILWWCSRSPVQF
jgi:hypothetical protein